MRVLHVFKDAFPPTYGGVEQHVWEVARSLGTAFDMTILTSSRSRRRVEDRHGPVRFVRSAEYGRVASTPITPAWLGEIRRARPDIVHLHLPLPAGELSTLASGFHGGVIASFHADAVRRSVLSRPYRALQQRFLRRADRIVVGSEILADTSPGLALHRDRTVVIPYGVDVENWPKPDAASVAGIRGAGEPVVLFLGRLVRYKGVDVLIEAMRTIDATLHVVGDGPERPPLEAAARRAGADGRVHFVGHVTDDVRSSYYAAADVFVLPAVSRAESFGIAMLEAMAFGTPAVSTEVGTATSWVNRHGETGTVVLPGDPAALAAAVNRLLADEDLRKTYGDAAARRAREQFANQAMLDRLAEVYRSVAPLSLQS